MSSRILFFAIATGVFSLILASAPVVGAKTNPNGTHAHGELNPTPELDPSDVIRIQLDALRSNAVGNEGIAITYRFASPDNRKVTGPLPRFVAMIRSPPYDRLLNHKRVEYGPVRIVNQKAYQPIVVTDAGGQNVGYLWVLSRQDSGKFKDCWMTDAVISTEKSEPQRFALQVLAAVNRRA